MSFSRGQEPATAPTVVHIVEDDELWSIVIERSLQKKLGPAVEVRTFSQPEEWLDELAYDTLPDVIILDNLMPGFIGTELLEAVRSVVYAGLKAKLGEALQDKNHEPGVKRRIDCAVEMVVRSKVMMCTADARVTSEGVGVDVYSKNDSQDIFRMIDATAHCAHHRSRQPRRNFLAQLPS